MADRLFALATAAMARWNLAPDGADLPTDDALLRPVRQGDLPLMLKICDPASDELGQGDILAALDGQQAVRVMARHGPALLMERLTPTGPSLTDMALSGRDAAAMGILCDLALTWHHRLRDRDLPRLIPFDDRLAVLGTPASDPAHRALLAWARTLDVRGDPHAWHPLHGDLHHANVLHDAARGWCAIDPKGILGPAPYDLANAILNPFPQVALTHDPARMAATAAIAAARLSITPARMLTFAALQGGLGLAWSLQDSEAPYWATCARIAGGLAGLSPPG